MKSRLVHGAYYAVLAETHRSRVGTLSSNTSTIGEKTIWKRTYDQVLSTDLG